jgi:hypothetical protein
MTKKIFFAQQWFPREPNSNCDMANNGLNTAAPNLKSRFPTFTNHLKHQPIDPDARFSPLSCFTPGWKGDSLPSKLILKFEKLIQLVQLDVKNELLRTKDFTRTIKMGLYSEFLSYAESLGLHFENLDDMGKFWQMIASDLINEDPRLAQFIDIYAGRVATINFLKLRFAASLLNQENFEVNDRAILSPSSFLSQIFKKGGQNELNSQALETNLYSWYRPSEAMKEIMKELMILSKDLAISEIVKNVSYHTQVSQDKNKIYSHALSHVGLGLFLNSLQINFPLWLEAIEGSAAPTGNSEEEEIISCKFFGDYLESLSLSHWLAQENNIGFRWDQILCPEFKGFEFVSGTFAKLCNELQFLTFLVKKAEKQGDKPIDYICKIMGGHYRNRKNTHEKLGLFLEDNPFYSSTYDRVVLNLCHFPKNNPQHYLITQIMDQIKYLKPNGFLYVLSSKKLFVPSLRDRLDPLVKELKTEAIFDLEDVKGKGELGNYIYIFRKRSQDDAKKQLCSYFRVSADLSTFQNFSSITEHLRSFYLTHLDELPAMAQLEFADSFRIDFFQEALVNGMLIHSANEDSSRITHPNFFKGLLDGCVPLESLFEIKSLQLNNQPSTKEHSLNLGLKKDSSYFMVVDFRDKEVKLELHPLDTFRSIYADYGVALCSYFEVHPKINGLNPNILRNYFLTPIGKQVANLTFTGGPSLVKGSLKKFLVPKFLTQTEALPSQLLPAFSIFEYSEEQFLETSPQSILKSFNHVDQITRDILPRYACAILSQYTNLERTLQSLQWELEDSRSSQKISFNNPTIQNKLVKKRTSPMYPNNPDIYFEFVDASSPMDIHLPLTQIQTRTTLEGDIKLHSLEMFSGSKLIVRLHAEEIMVLFIQFLLTHATNAPISKILKAVYVPSSNDLKEIIEITDDLKNHYQSLLAKVTSSIQFIFRTHVSPKR